MIMRIVVATDCSEAASGALRLARTLAERHQASVEVVSALEQLPIHSPIAGNAVVHAHREMMESRLASLQQRVEEQLTALGPEFASWPVTIAIGQPATTIVRLAAAKKATLLLLGLGRHGLTDRWFGSETALQVMRLAHVPVLAVPTETTALPRTAVVGIDFTEFSRDAAETALQLLEPGGTLHLVHVLWKPSLETPWVGGEDWIETQRRQACQQLAEMAQTLERSAAVRVPVHYLEGNAPREVLRLARTVGAELVAAGSHGAGFVARLMMGSVSTRLVRGATCSVLIAPPRTVPAELQNAPQAETLVAEPALVP